MSHFQLQLVSELTHSVSNAAPSASTCAEPIGGIWCCHAPAHAHRYNTDRDGSPGRRSSAPATPMSFSEDGERRCTCWWRPWRSCSAGRYWWSSVRSVGGTANSSCAGTRGRAAECARRVGGFGYGPAPRLAMGVRQRPHAMCFTTGERSRSVCVYACSQRRCLEPEAPSRGGGVTLQALGFAREIHSVLRIVAVPPPGRG